MSIDVEGLRNRIRYECSAAYFFGGMGGALTDAIDVDNAEFDELIEIARQYGIDRSDFTELDDEDE